MYTKITNVNKVQDFGDEVSFSFSLCEASTQMDITDYTDTLFWGVFPKSIRKLWSQVALLVMMELGTSCFWETHLWPGELGHELQWNTIVQYYW